MNTKDKITIEKFENRIDMNELREKLNATKKYRPTDYKYKHTMHLAKRRGPT